MNNLVLYYIYLIVNEQCTNINDVPKLYRAKVRAKCEELGIIINEDGSFTLPEE